MMKDGTKVLTQDKVMTQLRTIFRTLKDQNAEQAGRMARVPARR